MPAVTTQNVSPTSLALTSMGDTQAMLGWADTRWGATEIYVEAVNYNGCQ
jgi:hypothetical protein